MQIWRRISYFGFAETVRTLKMYAIEKIPMTDVQHSLE